MYYKCILNATLSFLCPSFPLLDVVLTKTFWIFFFFNSISSGDQFGPKDCIKGCICDLIQKQNWSLTGALLLRSLSHMRTINNYVGCLLLIETMRTLNKLLTYLLPKLEHVWTNQRTGSPLFQAGEVMQLSCVYYLVNSDVTSLMPFKIWI